MAVDIALLIVSLFVILFSAELFTNGIEWVGDRLQLSTGVVGSVLAAVGTALPETLIPFVAVLFFKGEHGHQVGIGAIAGAPFMLSTLTLAVCGLSMWIFARRGSRPAELILHHEVLVRDLRFFSLAYAIGLLGTLASPNPPVRWVIALSLVGIYWIYLYRTFTHEGEVGVPPEVFHFERLIPEARLKLWLIILQAVIGLLGILGGAFLFVGSIEDVSHMLGVPALILSLIVAPIATELPEKVNSVLWARSGKDTLALGNITGALVFQSCFPVAFGVAFTQWALTPSTICTGVVAIVSALIYMRLIQLNKLRSTYLMCGMLAYAATISAIITLGLQTD